MTHYCEPLDGIPTVYLMDYMAPIEWPKGFSWDEFYKSERDLIDPALKEKGWVKVGEWYSSEHDSFGPLSRACRYKTPEGQTVKVWYG